MAWALVQVASATASGANSVTTNFTAATANNLLVAFAQLAKGAAAAGSIVAPSGWTGLTEANNSAAATLMLRGAYKVAAGGETKAVFNAAAATATGGWTTGFQEYSGNARSTPLIVEDCAAIALSGTVASTPVVTTVESASALVCFALGGSTTSGTWSGQAVNSATAGVVEDTDKFVSGGADPLTTCHLFVTPTATSYSASGTLSAAGFLMGAIAVFNSAVKPQFVTATSTSTASIVKQVNKVVTASGTSTATIVKVVNKLLTGTSTTTATIQKVVTKFLTATGSSLAFLTAVKVAFVTMVATATSTASIVKLVNKNVFATGTSSASLTKLVNKTLTGTSASTATIKKVVNKVLTGTASSSASIVKTVRKTLTATATSTATLVATKIGPATVYAQALVATCTTTAEICTHRILSLASRAGSALAAAATTVGSLLTSPAAPGSLAGGSPTTGSLTTTPANTNTVTTEEECD